MEPDSEGEFFPDFAVGIANGNNSIFNPDQQNMPMNGS